MSLIARRRIVAFLLACFVIGCIVGCFIDNNINALPAR